MDYEDTKSCLEFVILAVCRNMNINGLQVSKYGLCLTNKGCSSFGEQQQVPIPVDNKRKEE
jgi:hypothetical protein